MKSFIIVGVALFAGLVAGQVLLAAPGTSDGGSSPAVEFLLENCLWLSLAAGLVVFCFLIWRLLKPVNDRQFDPAGHAEDDYASIDSRGRDHQLASSRDPNLHSSDRPGHAADALPGSGQGLLSRLLGWLVRSLVQSGVIKVSRVGRSEVSDSPTRGVRTYRSFDELPPEIRAKIEQMRASGG